MQQPAPPATTGNQLAQAPARQACIRQAALLLGAPEADAQAFADTGSTLVEGVALHVIVSPRPDGAWLATAQLPRPADVAPADWADALLQANAQAMLTADWAFAMAENDDAVLVMHLPTDLPDHRFLAGRFDGMLTLCRAVSAAVVAPAPGSLQ
jgi:hypothetical protein